MTPRWPFFHCPACDWGAQWHGTTDPKTGNPLCPRCAHRGKRVIADAIEVVPAQPQPHREEVADADRLRVELGAAQGRQGELLRAIEAHRDTLSANSMWSPLDADTALYEVAETIRRESPLAVTQPPAGREEAPEQEGDWQDVVLTKYPEKHTLLRDCRLHIAPSRPAPGYEKGDKRETYVPVSKLSAVQRREEALREALETEVERLRDLASSRHLGGSVLIRRRPQDKYERLLVPDFVREQADSLQAILDSNPSPASGEPAARAKAAILAAAHDDEVDPPLSLMCSLASAIGWVIR